jgi:hypothetical protein
VQPRFFSVPNSTLTDQLFPDKLMIEFNSSFTESKLQDTANALSNNMVRDRLFLNNITEDICDKYILPILPTLNVKVLGLKKMDSHCVEKICRLLSKSRSFPQLFGMDELDAESLKIIFTYFVSILSRNFHVHIIFGPSIRPEWVAKFNKLYQPNELFAEVHKTLKVLIEHRTTDRIQYLQEYREIKESLHQAEIKYSELEEKEDKTQQKLSEVSLQLNRKKQRLSEANGLLKHRKEKEDETQNYLKLASARIDAIQRDSKGVESELAATRQILQATQKENEALRGSLSESKQQCSDQGNHLAITQIQLRDLQKQLLDSQRQFVTSNKFVTDTLEELKQTQLFQVHHDKKMNETFMQNKKKRKHSEEKPSIDTEAVNNLLKLMSDSSRAQDVSSSEEKINPDSILEQFQTYLLDTMTKRISQSKPALTLKAHISREIAVCDAIFQEGRPFTQLSTSEIKSLFYYIAFLVCDIHHKNSKTKQHMGLTIYDYLTQTQKFRPIGREALLHTMNRMADAVLNVTEANMLLRVEKMASDQTNNALKKEIQQSTGYSSLSIATSRSVLFSRSSTGSVTSPDSTRSNNMTM